MLAAFLVSLLASTAFACESCSHDIHTRMVRRQQPESLNATSGPKGPLEWGQINFLHTTDTHAWLEGHLKEQNYGADWGDFVSFTKHMRHKAKKLGVDLLLVDSGDHHDGAGLSDATTPNGVVANPIFQNVDYDVLAIGNHELYLADVAYLTYNQVAKFYGDRYVTSNVYIRDNSTGKFEFIGKPYRYFTTDQGLRVMAFGVLYDFTGNTNVTKVVKAKDMVKETWFVDAVNTKNPVDLFLVVGHNPAAPNVSSSTFGTVHSAIRGLRPDIPIQLFGGHNHIRDFQIYDSSATALGSGRYCETVGWLSMGGIRSSNFRGSQAPKGVPNPTRKAVKSGNYSASASPPLASDSSSIVYSRRYLDWNRLTFAFHARGSQDSTFDTSEGQSVTTEITTARKTLNLTTLYGCAPQTYCMTCVPFGSNGSIYGLIPEALALTVINPARANIPRLITTNTGSIRFDLVKGPFTYDDAFIVSPFENKFVYVADVPYPQANKVLDILNAGPFQKRMADASAYQAVFNGDDGCSNRATAPLARRSLTRRSTPPPLRQTPGYVTTDAFGSDGDDTPHSPIPAYPLPNDVQARAGFPKDGSDPKTVDFVFVDFIAEKFVVPALNQARKEVGGAGSDYELKDVKVYVEGFTSRDYLPAYARKIWDKGPRCSV